MKCDCIKIIEGKVAVFMAPKAGEDCTAKVQGTVFYMDGSRKVGDAEALSMALQIPFRVKGSRKGFTGERGKEIGVNVAFCPFCGRNAKRHVVGEDIGIAALMEMGAA